MQPPQDDAADLARFGYRQELDRRLGGFSAFAAGFSYLSILTGVFQMFYLGFGAGGPAFIWSWPLVLAGQFLVALGFAELAAHYPLSGGAYQWSKLAGSPRTGFVVGWIYLACLVVTLAAVALALQASLPQLSPAFQFVDAASNPRASALNAVILGCALIVVTTILNAIGVGIVAKINNAGVITELTGALLLAALLWLAAVRPPREVLMAAWQGDAASLIGPLLASAALTASYVMYGFDTAGSLAEETTNPRRHAPFAILQALAAAGAIGFAILLGALMAARDLGAGELTRIDGGLPSIVTASLGGTFGRLLLANVVFAIVVCAITVQAGAVRLVFAMARDRLLPYSRALAAVSPVSKTPVLPVLVVGAAAITILVANVNVPKLVELVTMVAVLWANLAYLIVTGVLWRKRRRGWPSAFGHSPQSFGDSPRFFGDSPRFSLGRLGLPVTGLAFVWSAFMVVNVGWPRASVYGEEWQHRFAPIILTAILLLAAVVAAALSERRLSALDQRSGGSMETV